MRNFFTCLDVGERLVRGVDRTLDLSVNRLGPRQLRELAGQAVTEGEVADRFLVEGNQHRDVRAPVADPVVTILVDGRDVAGVS